MGSILLPSTFTVKLLYYLFYTSFRNEFLGYREFYFACVNTFSSVYKFNTCLFFIYYFFFKKHETERGVVEIEGDRIRNEELRSELIYYTTY